MSKRYIVAEVDSAGIGEQPFSGGFRDPFSRKKDAVRCARSLQYGAIDNGNPNHLTEIKVWEVGGKNSPLDAIEVFPVDLSGLSPDRIREICEDLGLHACPKGCGHNA